MSGQLVEGWYLVAAPEATDAPNSVDTYYGSGDADRSGRWGEYLPTWPGAVVEGREAADALAAHFAGVWADQGETVEYTVGPLDLSRVPYPWEDRIAEFVGVEL